MARSFHSSTASSMAPSLSSSESQNSNREHELEIEDEQIFGDDDRNVLVQSDHLQMQNPVRPSTVNFESNGATSGLEVGTSGSGSSPVITPTRSTTDMPNTVGNTARRDNGSLLYPEPEEHPVESQAYQQNPYSQQRLCWWESNYKEASIFLEEGENNDKFSHHPRSFDALPAYLLVHNKWFNIGDLCAAIVLLCLGFVEEPCMSIFSVPVQVHASIELCSLVLIATMQVLRTRWTGWRAFFGHKRTAIKVLALIVMIMEALVVIVHRHNHFRITRSVRPIFLIDNHFLGGVRRFIRQILQSLPPILGYVGSSLFCHANLQCIWLLLVWKARHRQLFNAVQEFCQSVYLADNGQQSRCYDEKLQLESVVMHIFHIISIHQFVLSYEFDVGRGLRHFHEN